MKTQIYNLINGMENVDRIESAKYLNAKQATSHVGYAGTNRKERMKVAEKVYSENGDIMEIEINGEKFALNRKSSTTGKTEWYSAEVSEDFAKQFINTDGNIRSYSLVITHSCEVLIDKYVRSNERSQWRLSYTQYIDESYVTIL